MPKFIAALPLLLALPLPLFAAPAPGPSAAPVLQTPLFPEDGSLPMRSWYTRGRPPAGVQAALDAEGVQARDINFDYEWIQDIALFRADGKLALEASAPPELLQELSLTMGVLNNEDGFPSLTAIGEGDAAAAGLDHARMTYTFVEGGGLITGVFPDGSPYAITTWSPIHGAALIRKHRTGEETGDEAARALVAADLGVKPENLFIVPASGHLDLIMTPLPGGVLVLSDPSKTIGVMRAALAGAPSEEKRRLKSMIKVYEEGWQEYPGAYRKFPYSERDQQALDRIAGLLEGRFRVIRAAGVFNELEKYGNSDSYYLGDRINFFNGFTGSNAGGELFQVTNSGRGLSSLEKYWSGLLAAHGVRRVHFPGSYSLGAGLDCTGAPSAK